MKKILSSLAAVCLATASSPAALVVFQENMGTTTTPATQTIAANVYQNYTGDLTYLGTGDLRTTAPSTGYTGASGVRNVFLTNTAGTSFTIGGIDTVGFSGYTFSFGAIKTLNASNMLDLTVTSAGSSGLGFPAQSTGPNTSNWRLVTSTGPVTLASGNNVSITFTNTAAQATQYRVDDVTLTANKLNRTYTTADASLVFGLETGSVFGSGVTQTAVAMTSGLAGGLTGTTEFLNASLAEDRRLTTGYVLSAVATNDADRVTDVFNLTGLVSGDYIVMQMTLTGTEAGYLGTLSGGEWVNAGNESYDLFEGSYSAFLAANPSLTTLTSQAGYYGFDEATGSAWAVVGSNGSYALLVPEPTTVAMLLGGLGLMAFARRKRSQRA